MFSFITHLLTQLSIFLILGLLDNSVCNAQLNGVYTIPGSYPNITSAVTSLNAVGVSGNVTFNISVGYTENAPVGGIVLQYAGGVAVANQSNASQTVIFQRSGVGANPIINAYTGTQTSPYTSLDGIVKIVGSDYITFDGIDVSEIAGNITSTTMMEFGYGLLRVSNTNGTQNCVIKNSTIGLNNSHITNWGAIGASGSIGIFSGPINNLAITVLAPAGASIVGANSNNKFSSNTISNVTSGIFILGIADVTSPYSFYDQSNFAGDVLAGNTIQNYKTYGVYCKYQNNVSVLYNAIDNDAGGIAATSSVYGVYHDLSINTSPVVKFNDVSLNLSTGALYSATCAAVYDKSSGTGTVTISNNTLTLTGGLAGNVISFYCIFRPSVAATNAVVVENNNFRNIDVSYNSPGIFYLFCNQINDISSLSFNFNFTSGTALPYVDITVGSAACSAYGYVNSSAGLLVGTVNITNNTFTEFEMNMGNTFYMFNESGGNPTNTFTKTISNNIVKNVYTYVSTFLGIGEYKCGGLLTFNNNLVENISGADVIWATNIASKTNFDIYNNIVTNINANNSFIGIYTSGGGTTGSYGTIRNNEVYNLHVLLSSAPGPSYGIRSENNPIGTTTTINNNSIYDLSTDGTGLMSLFGISCQGADGTPVFNIYNNLVTQLELTNSAAGSMSLTGIKITKGNYNIYYNTVALGYNTALVSTAPDFGVAALSFGISGSGTPGSTTSLDLRNNILYANATKNGTGVVSALQRGGGTAGIAPANFALSSGYNIYYAPNVTDSYLYSEGTTVASLVNGYNLTNDPKFNSVCSLYKTFMTSAGEDSTVTEIPPFIGIGIPSVKYSLINGTLSYAESGAQTIGLVPTDFNAVSRPNNLVTNRPDIGFTEFSGIKKNIVPLPVVNIIADTTVCENFGVTLNTTSTGTYLWTGPSGNMTGIFTSTLQNPTNPVFLGDGFANEGWYYLTVTNSDFCTATDSIYITILAVPSPSIASSILNCVQTLTGSAGASNGPIVTYAWGPGGGNSLGTTSVINLPPGYPGPQVVFTVTDTEGCAAGVIMLAGPLVPPNVTADAPLVLTCAAPSGIITASSTTPGATFSWAGPGIVFGGATSSPTVNAAGTYTVTVTDPLTGCTSTANVIVTSTSTLPAPIIYTPNSWYCIGDNTTPLNSSSGNLWYSNPGLTTLVGTGLSYSPSAIVGISTYYVVDTVGGCISSPASVTVEFVNCPAPACGTNLLSNGGFENYSSCPTNTNQLANATSWIGTGDYYNTICNGYYNSPAYYPFFNAGNYLLGLAGGGVFPPPVGAGSVGLILGGTIFKNFVTQQVPLSCSKQYTLQFRATAPRSDTPPDNSLCVYGSNTPPPYSGCTASLTLLACLPSPASIDNYWKPQTLTFTPTVNYTYLVITGQCPTATVHGGTVFLDDLLLCATCVNPPASVSANEILPETCIGNDGEGTVSATTCAVPLTYSWALSSNPGVPVSTVQSPINLVTGNYTVTVTDAASCSSTGSVLINTFTPVSAPTASVTVQPTCTTPTGTIVVAAPLGATIQYSNGGAYQVGTTFSGLAPGNYNITAQNMTTGCISAVTVLTVNAIPTAPAAPTASVTIQPTCTTPTGTIVVAAPIGATIQYSNGGAYQVGTTFSGLAPGNYNITAQDMTTGCISAVTVLTVNAVGAGPTVTVSPDVIINLGTSTTLNAFGANSYTWTPITGLDVSTGATVIASPNTTTIYCVIGQDLNGCTDTACAVVTISIDCGNLFVPNVFSPNENSLDDELCLFGADCIQGLSFKIYNRWGELIYESTDPKECWNGTYKEKIVSTGVYAYTLEATSAANEPISKKGTITVVK